MVWEADMFTGLSHNNLHTQLSTQTLIYTQTADHWSKWALTENLACPLLGNYTRVVKWTGPLNNDQSNINCLQI